MGPIFSLVIGWVFRTLVIKFVAFTALYLLTTAVVGYIANKLPTIGALQDALASFTPAMWYFMDLTLFTQMFPAFVSALILRWSIKRIPGLG